MMFWEQITVDQFAAARETCGGVCVIPIGCLEKHGNQLPLGTDILTARTAAALAAEKSEVMIFPYLPFGIVSEVKHKLGTVALSSQLQYHMLEELCEEIARNGFHKILFVNGHGGNTNFLRYFSQSRHEHPCDYTVFTYELSYMTDEQYESFLKLNGPVKESGHADIYETSVVMAVAPEQVHMEALRPQDGHSLCRMDAYGKAGAYAGISWYASYPCQLAGDPSEATVQKGELLLNAYVNNLVKLFDLLKKDDVPGELQEEFYMQCYDPQV